MIRPKNKALPSLLALSIAGSCVATEPPIAVVSESVNKSLAMASDVTFKPNGSVEGASWAQAILNSGATPVEGGQDFLTIDYLYPETSTEVRLYLVDTSVDPAPFAANENLTINPPELLGFTSPGESRSTGHGTRMLGLIAGPAYGVALGTKIEVVNYDIFPDGEEDEGTYGLLVEAIENAIDHHDNPENGSKPGVLCLALGSASAVDPEIDFSDVEVAIEEALEVGLAVIVSAGNESGDASQFIPARYGSDPGVICVGATDRSNLIWSGSNTGQVVDLFAPGDFVPTVNASDSPSDPSLVSLSLVVGGGPDLMLGTSPATALVTGAALARLSLNSSLSPAELEDVLKDSQFETVGGVPIVQLPPIDSDGDGAHDLLETFAGSDPLSESELPRKPFVSGSGPSGGETELSINFEIDAKLFNPSAPFELANGMTWKIKESSDLRTWTDSTSGVLSQTGSSDSTVSLSYTLTGAEACCFLKLEIAPAPAE